MLLTHSGWQNTRFACVEDGNHIERRDIAAHAESVRAQAVIYFMRATYGVHI